MKILFICGSLEEGKDGVGDYTRRLAGEVIRQGNACAIIALTDKYVNDIKEENQESEGTIVPVLRSPYKNGYKKNAELAKPWLTSFNPDWVSLQYVPFSFQDKGLPFGLGAIIKKLTQGCKVHIMFHELWVGMNKEASLKLKVWGEVQKNLLKMNIKVLKPQKVNTHVELYNKELSYITDNVNILPLFGNIPVNYTNDKQNKIKEEKIKKIIFFGNIHYGAPVDDLFIKLNQIRNDNQIDFEFVFIGNCGAELKDWIKCCNDYKYKNNVLGLLSSYKISNLLQEADYGISTTPWLLIQKSGTVAAMIEHKLPVLCVSRDWFVNREINENKEQGLQLFNNVDLLLFFKREKLKDSEVNNTLQKVSVQFLKFLEK